MTIEQAAVRFIEVREAAKAKRLEYRKAFSEAHPYTDPENGDFSEANGEACFKSKGYDPETGEPWKQDWCAGCLRGSALRDEWKRVVAKRVGALVALTRTVAASKRKEGTQ